MELTLTSLRDKEILNFIGNAQTCPDENMLRDIAEMKEKIILLSTPRFLYKEFTYNQSKAVEADLLLVGDDIQRLLKESHHCIFMAVTLGAMVDKEMRRLQLFDMGKAFIFDCCASAAIEHICDQIQNNLEMQYQLDGLYLTDRYSCGYGDLPVTLQNDFLRVLDTQKKIGLYVSENSILHPMKSVTAILGVANEIQPAILRGCAFCRLKDHCVYRKGGTTCGQ